MDIDLKQVRELMRALKQFGMSELEIKVDKQRIRIRRDGVSYGGSYASLPPASMNPPPAPAQVPYPGTPPTPAASSQASSSEDNDPAIAYITSPFVGTFYRSPSPESPSFVKEGDNISSGKVLCIVEAMKLMNEIEAEISGTILEILVENGTPVEYGERLFKVRKT